MAINSLYGTTRIMGMSSGMDTESIIQQMMKLQQLKVDRQFRAKTELEWKKTALNGIKDELKSFQNSFISSLGANSLRLSGPYNSTVATLTGANADAVTIATDVYTETGGMRIGQISSLASAASASSEGVTKYGTAPGSNVKLGNMDSLLNSGLRFEKEDPDDDDSAEVIKFKINDVEFTFGKDTTLGDMMTKINNSKAGVTMKYDRNTDGFSVTAKTTGADTRVKIENILGNAFGSQTVAAPTDDDPNATQTFASAFGIQEGTYEGTNAKVKINGTDREFTSNTFEFGGVTMTLNRTTDAGDPDTQVTLKRDATEAVKKIETFVEAYNTIIKKLEGLLKERKTRSESSYTPLTDEEKADMTEKQIADWEAIAKKGLLKNDAGIQNLVTGLRGALYDAVEGAGLSPSDIGLSTGSYFGGTGGQIVIDKEALTAALEKDPERVMNVFTNYAAGIADEGEAYKKNGLLHRIDKMMNDYVKESQYYSLENLDKSLRRANEQMDKLQEKMYAEEERLYKQFAAMETALSKIQSQGDWLTSMLGGG